MNRSSKAHIIHHKKKMILYKKDIFVCLKNFRVPIYSNNLVHFRDICVQLAHNAVCKRFKLSKIELL